MRRLVALLLLSAALGGCSLFEPRETLEPAVAPAPVARATLPPLATHVFPFDPRSDGVVGALQETTARAEDTLADLARRFNLGYDEIVRANPGVDPWLPGEGTRILLPTQFVLPDAPPEGIVVNLAALRLFYFPKPAPGAQRVVVTHPIGIGKVGWATPEGTTTVTSKRKDPYWTPPASVRREHAAEGDVLPARVPPGPDNPLGAHAMNLGWPSYLIHGTNKPAGVGMRASHGCIRLYPEDIAVLFDEVAVGTKLRVVNQPVLYRWPGSSLYVQAYPLPEELAGPAHGRRTADAGANEEATIARLWQRARPRGGTVDAELAARVLRDRMGIATPVSYRRLSFESYLAEARPVSNVAPEGSNQGGADPDAGAVLDR